MSTFDENYDGHHTPEEVDAAFAYAPKVLRQLRGAGVKLPRLELFCDASGMLVLGSPKEVTKEQMDLAVSLVRSQRFNLHRDDVAISFCCGLVVGSKENSED